MESAKTFASLYQQRPAPLEGNLIKAKWFENKISKEEFIRKCVDKGAPINYYIDTAYTDKTKNDPSLILATCFFDGILYIVSRKKGRWEFPDIIKIIPQFISETGHSAGSQIIIEPKASGLSIKQQLKRDTMYNLPHVDPPKDDKFTRASSATPFMEGQRIVLIEADWNEDFISQLTMFPNAKHDEEVDCLVMAIMDVLKRIKKAPGVMWQ